MDAAPLISPKSVAVVGATEREGTYADLMLRNLDAWDFEGPVWGVNPKRDEVHGRTCVPTVADLPEPVDAVFVAIPAAAVPEVIEQAGARGCGGAVVVSAGFAEIDAGRELQRELREAALRHDLPLCGPNGNGVLAVHGRAPLWGDSVVPLQPGPVAMISQSGNVAVNAIGSRRGIDFHTVVSTGNQAVLDASDWLAALAEVEGVRSVALFLESDGHGGRFSEALARCAERDVGVAVLKVGSSEAGTRAAAAHTGSVAGDQRVFRALVEEAGAAWARDVHELLELAKVLAEPRARPRGSGGLAVLTCSGGDSALAADEAERMEVSLPDLSQDTRAALTEMLPDAATVGNPLDYTAIVWGDIELLAEMMRVVGADPAIAQLLMIYDHPQGMFGPGAESWTDVRAGIIEGAERTDAAVIVCSTLPDLIDETAITELAAREVPVVAGLREALSAARALRTPPGDPARMREVAAAASRVGGRPGQWLAESDAKDLLRTAGVPVPDGELVEDEDAAVSVWTSFASPVAIKLSAPGLLHKSEAGALALSLEDEDEVREAYRRLRSLNGHADASVLVERMAEGEAELLIAARSDGVVPSLVVGLGGIWTEALADVAVIPLPADADRVEQRLLSLRGIAAITGGRGRETLDLDAAAEVAVATGRLLLSERLSLVELNPVMLGRQGAVAVDAVVGRGVSKVPDDAVVVGAGLAGLSAARDLTAGGADVVVLEARRRPGGRVEQAQMPDGRLVQLGGELTGPFQSAYRGIVKELGLTLEPAFPSVPGEETFMLAEGRFIGDGHPWMSDEDRASYAAVEEEFRKLTGTVDPDDPWSHPEAERLDRLSIGAWMRDAGATRNAVRARELFALALSSESIERTSLLSELRKQAVAGATGFYEYESWESERVAEGSATVALRMAEGAGHRIRYATPVRRIRVSASGCTVTAVNGESFEAAAVVSALPVGPLRDVQVEGVSEERLASLHRQRHALAAKAVFAYPSSFWEDQGQNGELYGETGLIAGAWAQVDGILSTLVPPERLAPLLATPPELTESELTAEVVAAFGDAGADPEAVFIRRWGVDPWTQGYITQWRPGDVMAVGPLHGTHEPPFYVCGSDQWVCGYMEGAVRTGRAAAAAALAHG